MSWLDCFLMAVRGVMAHRFRALLTVTSITIGAFAIVFMSSLAESGLRTLSSTIEELGGARLIMITAKQPERSERKRGMFPLGFTLRDRDRIVGRLPHVVERALYASSRGSDVVADNGRHDRTDLVAADTAFFGTYRMKIGRGRMFTEEEERRRAPVCIVGSKLAARLWGESPIGRRMTVGALRCRVIGELEDPRRFGVDFGFDWADLAVAPLEAVADVDGKVRERSILVVKADDSRSNDAVKRIVNALLLDRHRGIDDFQIIDFAPLMSKFEAVFTIMKILVALIAGIALLVGGIGVMNMMLVGVSERVREIGIRKALGAAPLDIGAQFLWEAALVSSFGGLLGTAAGVGAAALSGVIIEQLLPRWIGATSIPSVVAALLASFGTGIIFGWLPARRASGLDPVEAMRR